MPDLLEVERLEAAYGDFLALTGVTLTVAAGEVVALVGSNGAGKTTLLRSIAGLLRPRAGRIRWRAEELQGRLAHEIVARGVALVPEGRRLFARMTVEENLYLGAFTPRAAASRLPACAWVYEIFPRLAERRRQLAGALSGGEQQMVAIGRALMSQPALLMLDEPSLGLAPQVVETIFRVLDTISRRGVSILLVEQNVPAALGLAGRAYLLEGGRIVGEGRGADLLGDPAVRRAYLGPLALSG